MANKPESTDDLMNRLPAQGAFIDIPDYSDRMNYLEIQAGIAEFERDAKHRRGQRNWVLAGLLLFIGLQLLVLAFLYVYAAITVSRKWVELDTAQLLYTNAHIYSGICLLQLIAIVSYISRQLYKFDNTASEWFKNLKGGGIQKKDR